MSSVTEKKMYCYHCMSENREGDRYCLHCGKEIKEDSYPHHLKPGTILDNKYLVGNAIGEGGFGITYVGLDLTLDMKIAIKEFYPSGFANRNNTVSNKVTLNFQNEGEYFKTGRESFLREAKSIAKFHGEKSIVDVRAFFEENETAYIIMEYLDGENLSDRLKNVGTFEPAELFRMFIPVMQTLEKMHRENIIHRDISPENVRMISDGTLKLMDFGSARYYAGMEKKTMSIQFKPGFAPFEQYNKNGNQGPWTDVYGLCATIYKCITGVTPVDPLERCQHDTLQKPSELGVNISDKLEAVLMYGLAIYPENRCQDMEELIRLTEGALRNEKTVIGYAGSSATSENINKTRAADEQYKTMFANQSYGTGEAGESNTQQLPVPDPQPPVRPKGHKVLIAVLIALTVLVVAAIGVLTYTLIKGDNEEDNQETTASTTTAAEIAGEEQVTNVAATTVPTADNNVTMVSVVGKKLSDAQKELQDKGLKVETTEEINANFQKGYVTRQSIEAGQALPKGTTIMLVVSKGSGVNTEPYNQKVVVTAESGSSYATLRMYSWENGDWSKKMECPATVGKDGGISSDNSESNSLTPKGTFHLGKVLTASDQATGMSQYKVNANTVICDDVNYPNLYNQILDRSGLSSNISVDKVGEKLMSGSNNALIFIEHNGTGFSSSGVRTDNSSVITICGCYDEIAPTYGCIDISASDMVQLLGLLNAGQNPYIITETN